MTVLKPPPEIVMTHEELGVMIPVTMQRVANLMCAGQQSGEPDVAAIELNADRLHDMLTRWIATERGNSDQMTGETLQ